MPLAARVSDFIRREHLLTPAQPVLLGVSGGADSLCLLGILNELGYRVVVAHWDHGWRAASWRDAEFVLRLANELGIPAVIERARASGGKATGLEEAGRQDRYAFFARTANEHGIRAVAVGHTADDHVETIWMHWLRGAGPDGLRGILPVGPLPVQTEARTPGLRLVRPLLELHRSETEAFCRGRGWAPRQDETNRDRMFLRARIRHDLLPALEGDHPGLAHRVTHSAQLMRELSEMVEGMAAEHESAIVHKVGTGSLLVSGERLEAQPAPVRRVVLRRALRRLRPDLRDIGFDAIDRLLGNGRAPARISLTGEIEAIRLRRDWLLLAPGTLPRFPEWPQCLAQRAHPLAIPGTRRLACGWRLLSRLRSGRSAPFASRATVGNILIDLDGLPADVSVRTPLPGDRIRPQGMKGHVKVFDLLSQEDIPVPLRARWPMLLAGEEVLWVAGVRRAEQGKITPRSRRVAEVRLIGSTPGPAIPDFRKGRE